MKKLLYFYFLLLFLITSCYKDINEFQYPQYLGHWNNSKTTINGIPDDIYPNNKVPHYIFGIAQSEFTLSTSGSLGVSYQIWRIDNRTTPTILNLYQDPLQNEPNMTFKILEEPYMGEMVISYQDSIIYYIKE